jgi:ribokinase
VILSLGSINADFQTRTPQPLAAGATLLGTDFVRLGGGKAANVAFLAHRLGHPAVLLGRVGDDDLREQALAPLRRAGLDLRGVATAPGTATAVSMIAVAPDGKKSIVLASNANDAWDDDAIRTVLTEIAAAPADTMLVADGEIAPHAATQAMRAAHRRNIRVVLDPAPADRIDPASLALCFAVSPDAREATQLTGIEIGDPSGAARAACALAERGVHLAVVKLADGGCVFTVSGRVTHIPPIPVEVVDTTGAGDAFTGALAVALCDRMPDEQAVLFATAASHVAVTRYGSQESYPTRTEIAQLLPRLTGNVRHLAP